MFLFMSGPIKRRDVMNLSLPNLNQLRLRFPRRLLRPPHNFMARSKTLIPICFLGAALFILSFPPDSFGREVTKKEVLGTYETVIVKTNQMDMYGYDLREITPKLKEASDLLVSNRFGSAKGLLDEIKGDLKEIEGRGPELLRRERKLVWLEIFFRVFFILLFALYHSPI